MDPIDSLDAYQQAALATAIFEDDARVIYPALKLAGEAGEVAEKIGKLIRDKGWRPGQPLPAEAIPDLTKELGDVLWYVAVLADGFGLTLSEVATRNVAKLRDRQQRGVLGGSGDNR